MTSESIVSRPLSLTQIRLIHTCAYAWHLRYRAGHLPVQSAAAWRGILTHAILRHAYHGLALEQTHRQVWQAACGPILPQLDHALVLAHAYAAAGKPQTKAAQVWRQEHPEYDATRAAIQEYQHRALGHLRWSERASLEEYYAASVALLDHEPDLILPNPILVEGQEPHTDGAILPETDDADEEPATYQLLPVTLGGIALYMVPDVVAWAHDGATIRVLDYKTSDRVVPAEVLADDAQLHLYVLGLRQNGFILPGQPVTIGQMTLTRSGPVTVEIPVDPDRHARVIRRLEALTRQAATVIAADACVPQKGLHHPFMSPCTTCDYAHVCDA